MDVKKEKNMHTNIIKSHKQIKIMRERERERERETEREILRSVPTSVPVSGNNILHHVQALNSCSMSKRLNKIRNVEFSVQTSDLVIQ